MRHFPCTGLIVALALAGCARIDTGQIDYRIAEPRPDKAAENTTGPLLPAKVYRRYLQPDGDEQKPFVKDEVFSIEIEQGMIGENILEGEPFDAIFKMTGEVAILTNVFEFAGSEADAAKARFLETGFVTPLAKDGEAPAGDEQDPSDVELKLVYFGDDVRKGQWLNFSNIPLKSATKYNGGSIGIQIVIMEVDVQSGPTASLLTTLARFGQQAIPGPSEVSDLLFDLGESLFTGANTDDKLFEYRFVLSRPVPDSKATQATFLPGRYVLRRAQDRRKGIDWSSTVLDHNTARLYKKGPAGDLVEERDDLYLVLNVRRFPKGTAEEFYKQETAKAFRDRLQTMANERDAPLTAVAEEAGKLLADRRSSVWRGRIGEKWADAEERLREYTAHLKINCSEDTAFKRKRDLKKHEAREALRAFLVEYDVGRNAGTTEKPEFSSGDRDALVSLIARYFMPWKDEETEQRFDSGSAFATAYVGKDATGDLVVLSLDTAVRNAEPLDTCPAPAA